MILFWAVYFISSFTISYCIYKLFSSASLGFVFGVISFGVLSGIWFIYPGSQEFAPIISILFLESTIIESNGYLRLFRPFLISLVLGIFFGFILFVLKKRLSFRKRKY